MPPVKRDPDVVAEVLESFELIYGILVFATAGRRDTAQTRITNLLNKPTFRDATPTLEPYPAGKYGAGPTLIVTLRMTNRADADAIWSEAEARSFGFLLDGSFLMQTSVSFDSETGEGTTTIVHRRSFPPAEGDV